tara:strand:+ start:36 stop:467 length:432 start_codon:yes stop_codon:yes gene_type:complete
MTTFQPSSHSNPSEEGTQEGGGVPFWVAVPSVAAFIFVGFRLIDYFAKGAAEEEEQRKEAYKERERARERAEEEWHTQAWKAIGANVAREWEKKEARRLEEEEIYRRIEEQIEESRADEEARRAFETAHFGEDYGFGVGEGEG